MIKSLSKSLKNRLIEMRRALFTTNSSSNFGDIIYDSKNHEYGINIGNIKYKDEENPRVLIITPDEETSGSRVRYTYRKNMKVVRDPDLNDDTLGKLELDLKIFCNEQCIFECDKDCILYKYKNKNDESKTE